MTGTSAHPASVGQRPAAAAEGSPPRDPDPLLATAPPEALREATLAGVRWGVVARVAIEAVSFLSSVALARLVSPVGFGHAATAIGVITLASGLTIEGFGTPLVQRRELTRAHVETALLLSMVGGVGLTALFFFAAPALGGVFGSENVSLVQLASPTFLAVAVTAVPQALQQRQLRFRVMSQIQMAALAAGVAISIALAVLGLGARALVIGQLANPVAAALLYALTMPRVRPAWRNRESREIAAFGSQTALSSVLFSIYANVDYVIVGAKLGPRATGFYWRAFQIGGIYQGKISQIMLGMALPVYSRTQDATEMRRVRRRIVQVHAAVIFPLLATYILLAPLLVPLIWGKLWEPAVVPSQILAVLGMIYALSAGTAAVLIAAGHPRAVLVYNVVGVAAYAGVVFAFAHYGLTSLCIAIVILSAVLYALQYYFLMDRLAGIPIRQLWEEIKPATISLLPLFAGGLLSVRALDGAGAGSAVTIAGGTVAALSAYCGSMRLVFEEAWSDLVLLFARVLPRGR